MLIFLGILALTLLVIATVNSPDEEAALVPATNKRRRA